MTGQAPPAVLLLGIRHHGPGSARSVRVALERYRPQVLLIEGPPEAEPLLRWISDPDLRPPVAIFAHTDADTGNYAFWPFAVFSPEWQALRWANTNGVPVRFVDQPAAVALARADRDEPADDEPGNGPEGLRDSDIRRDPLAVLARAAGFEDPERWWEDVVEHRGDEDPFTAFAAVAEAMSELRRTIGADRDEVREAFMRKALRAERRRHDRVAVVCGAWHVPALTDPLPPVKHDQALMAGLPTVKCQVAWVPWAHSRLARASGYGAGVASPGWYHHLFTATGAVIPRWLTSVAQVLRGNDLPTSSAHVIESTRLADTLAGLRGRPVPGLAEVTDAARAVLCDGDEALVELVHRELVVGELLGEVPEDAPAMPLLVDLRRAARSLRLPLSATEKLYQLDLRKETDVGRSMLLRRLEILQINWGTPASVSTTGTFKEPWNLCWAPELAIRVAEAAQWGTTVPAAATAKLLAGNGSLSAVTAGIEAALPAGLPQALAGLLSELDEQAARDRDIDDLLTALPALVRAARYGDVRGTDTSALATVAAALLVRISAGLPAAAAGAAPEAARLLVQRVSEVQRATALLAAPRALADWTGCLRELSRRPDTPQLLAGTVVRMLADGGHLDRPALVTRLAVELSTGRDPMAQAEFVEGLLGGSALLLLHDEELLAVLDQWVVGLPEDRFVDVVPAVRRTLGGFAKPERRAIADRLRRGSVQQQPSAEPDFAAAAAVLATGRLLLGLGEDR